MHGIVYARGPRAIFSVALLFVCISFFGFPPYPTQAADAPVPLLEKGKPVDWWFVYKFNAQTFPRCSSQDNAPVRACPFGGKPAKYNNSQQFVFASSEDSSLRKGG